MVWSLIKFSFVSDTLDLLVVYIVGVLLAFGLLVFDVLFIRFYLHYGFGVVGWFACFDCLLVKLYDGLCVALVFYFDVLFKGMVFRFILAFGVYCFLFLFVDLLIMLLLY